MDGKERDTALGGAGDERDVAPGGGGDGTLHFCELKCGSSPLMCVHLGCFADVVGQIWAVICTTWSGICYFTYASSDGRSTSKEVARPSANEG
jgi:hypothetical protein